MDLEVHAMTSRIAQLVARYVASALMALAGYLGATVTDEQAAATANAIAAGGVAFVGFAIDLWIHRRRTQ